MSTNQQQTYAVSTGLALGLLMEGKPRLDGQKTTLELAFRRAWRSWGQASRFPAVDRMVRAGQFNTPQMTATQGRRGHNPYVVWADGWPPTAQVRQGVDWDAQNAEDALFLAEQLGAGVTSDQWNDLARLLLDAVA